MAFLCILYYVNAPWQYDSVIFYNIVSWTWVKINGLLVPKTLVRVISYCYTPYIVCETLVIVVAQYHSSSCSPYHVLFLLTANGRYKQLKYIRTNILHNHKYIHTSDTYYREYMYRLLKKGRRCL
jgi:hypothetical protein